MALVQAILPAAPSFYAPLTNTIVPMTATGSATPSYSVSGSVGSIVDWEGIVRRTRTGEARFTGARRVQNLVNGHSVDITNASWTKGNSGTAGASSPTITANFATDPLGGSTATRLQMNRGSDATNGFSQTYNAVTLATTGQRDLRVSIWMKSNSGTPTIKLATASNIAGASGYAAVAFTLDSTWRRYTTPVLTGNSTLTTGYIQIGTYGTSIFGGSADTASVDILVWGAQFEDVSGQSNQNPGEYVSVGVTSTPYHGAAVDGVKYLATLNGNTVGSNIVTEATGAAITSASSGASAVTTDSTGPLGFLVETGGTNGVSWGSEDVSTGWTLTNLSSGTAIASPAGYFAKNALVENGVNGDHSLTKSFTRSSGTAGIVFVSLFVKAGLRDGLLFRIQEGANRADVTVSGLSTTPAITSVTITGASFVAGSSGLVSYPNGWYRAWFTFTCNTNTTYQYLVYLANAGATTYTGSNGSVGAYMWGMQFNDLVVSHSQASWAPDGAGRGGDALTYVFASNASASAGTAYAETTTLWSTSSYAAPLVAFGTATNFPLYSATEASTIIRVNDGTNNAQKTGISDMNTAARKVAASWNGSALAVTAAGATAATGTFDGDMGSTAIGVGTATTFTGNLWNGNIRNVLIYSVPASPAQLAAITSVGITAFYLQRTQFASQAVNRAAFY